MARMRSKYELVTGLIVKMPVLQSASWRLPPIHPLKSLSHCDFFGNSMRHSRLNPKNGLKKERKTYQLNLFQIESVR